MFASELLTELDECLRGTKVLVEITDEYLTAHLGRGGNIHIYPSQQLADGYAGLDGASVVCVVPGELETRLHFLIAFLKVVKAGGDFGENN